MQATGHRITTKAGQNSLEPASSHCHTGFRQLLGEGVRGYRWHSANSCGGGFALGGIGLLWACGRSIDGSMGDGTTNGRAWWGAVSGALSRRLAGIACRAHERSPRPPPRPSGPLGNPTEPIPDSTRITSNPPSSKPHRFSLWNMPIPISRRFLG